MRVLESVPNFSEGRDAGTIEAIGEAIGARARLLDVHADPDHNRSVFTLVGGDRELVDALLAGVETARERIDLRRHDGAHPRIGAADVVPIVPIEPGDLDRARAPSAAPIASIVPPARPSEKFGTDSSTRTGQLYGGHGPVRTLGRWRPGTRLATARPSGA